MDDPAQRPRILIVDESRMARAALIKRVREHYSFREEVDGEAGWQALVLDHSIQLVICALALPMLDGDGLLARVRSSRLTRLRQMPVLIIAGDNEEANERARALGASDFISRSVGTAELLTRIASLLARTQAQNDLAESVNRTAQHPATGLPTRQHIEVQAGQALAYANRHNAPASILVLGFDRFDELRTEHGDEVVSKLQSKLISILAQKVRKEDTLGHFSDSELAIVSPGTPYPACEAFANRLREAFAVAHIAVHGQRLDLSVSLGVASSPNDQVTSAATLITLAGDRLRAAQQAGGNRVLACVDQGLSEIPVPRLGHAIDLIRAGHAKVVIPHLVPLGKEMLPLLELLEREWKLGLPLADIRKRTLDREHEIEDTRQA
ncbi:MAG: diguanylate cyclase [Candidatus Accumulibacter sp.]|uniref:GGDEF domain-containing protein n=1 Tax=Accumulibacter sp. TaxID=2053492 RepID=UPI001A4F9D86|nr:diguanylate cyclase [Accumulibacter sp.]MBL8393446.1 diguanylate cyclase [Accumulibacter sp.]